MLDPDPDEMNADPQPCLKGGQALLRGRFLVTQMEMAEQLPAVGVDGVGLQHESLLPAGQLGNQHLREKMMIVRGSVSEDFVVCKFFFFLFRIQPIAELRIFIIW